jgi:hypothetical protein
MPGSMQRQACSLMTAATGTDGPAACQQGFTFAAHHALAIPARAGCLSPQCIARPAARLSSTPWGRRWASDAAPSPGKRQVLLPGFFLLVPAGWVRMLLCLPQSPNRRSA